MLAYLDHLEARGELDLETATEFLVLIAALLELKSRLMLPTEDDELLDLEPDEAAEELLARLLDAHRYRDAADHLARAARSASPGTAHRAAPLPRSLRRTDRGRRGRGLQARAARARRSAGCCASPPQLDLRHLDLPQGLASPSVSQHLRALLRRGRCSFDEAVRGADRMTVAVTLFALLELYKRGEARLGARPSRSARSRSSAATSSRAIAA